MYEITIERLEDDPNNPRYPNKTEIYAQLLDELHTDHLVAIITVINKIPTAPSGSNRKISEQLPS